MLICFVLIFLGKYKHTISLSNVNRQNTILMQTCGIAFYFSIYELGRLRMLDLMSYSFEFRVILYLARLLTISTINFIIYFVSTKSTRRMVLETLGYASKIKSTALATLT
uniref:Uncharacterized protein n=2 Tax=Caenorhabditis japonica TaxID=281687 RepID=A0A8R1EHY8_CAEJA